MNPLSRYVLAQLAMRRGLIFLRAEDRTVYVEPADDDTDPEVIQAAVQALLDDLNTSSAIPVERVVIEP